MLFNVQLNNIWAVNSQQRNGTRLIEKGLNQKFDAAGKTLKDFFQHSVVNYKKKN